MKPKCIDLSLALLGITLFIGCSKNTPNIDTVFTPIYREFDGQVIMTEGSAKLEDERASGSWNPKTRRGSRELHGIFTNPSAGNLGAEALGRIEEFIGLRTSTFHSEADVPLGIRPDQKKIYGAWIYNMGHRHGELHLWLFPDQESGSVAYAAYLREEDLK